MKPSSPAVMTRLDGGLRKPGLLHRTTRVALAALLVLSHPLWAATIIVDETSCTLVDAITAANTDSPVGGCAAGSGADTIVLTANVTLDAVDNAYLGDNGLPVVRSEIVLEGKGFTIGRAEGAPAFRLLTVAGNGTITLKHVELQNGSSEWGGAVLNRGMTHLFKSSLSGNSADSGGAIWSHTGASLTLTETMLFDNSAIFDGGAILSGNARASVTLTNSTISSNSAGRGGGGVSLQGGLATLDVTHSTVTGNTAERWGAGICAFGSYVNLTDSTVSGNSVSGDLELGGGIFASISLVTLTSTTVSGNSARYGGGMYFVQGGEHLTNSTVSGNSAVAGGGIFVLWGYLGLWNSTVSGNLGGGIRHDYGGDGDFTQLRRTIVSNNGGANCVGPIVDQGDNFSDGGCGSGFGAITGLDPVLADNGGPTWTHALLPGSSAIDAGGDCGLDTDQRGRSRNDGACNSGSYEFKCDIAVVQEEVGTAIYFTPESGEFDLVAGFLSDLRVDEDFSRAICLGTFLTSPAFDTFPDPPSGDGRYYLARGETHCVGARYGDSSLVPDPRDDLDTGPCS